MLNLFKKKFVFSKNFNLLPFNINLNKILKKNKKTYLIKKKKAFFLFNHKGKNLFCLHEKFKNIETINKNYFLDKSKQGKIPIIMNHYGDSHELLKKEHLKNINKYLKKYSSFFNKRANIFFNNIQNKKIDLIQEISKFIIYQQSNFFLKIKLNKNVLSKLFYFKDYFTLGLYINSKNLNKFYSNKKYLNSLKVFHNIYSYYTNKKKNYSNINKFYNYSIAGSTNIAKSVSYILILIIENYGSVKNLKKISINNEINIDELTDYIINEYYRLIPILNNQITSAFLVRKANKNFKLGRYSVNTNDNIFFFHTLKILRTKKTTPYNIFDVFRWHKSKLQKPIDTFGVGKHFCCGYLLANMYIKKIIKIILINYNCSSFEYKEMPYNHSFKMIKKLTVKVKLNKY